MTWLDIVIIVCIGGGLAKGLSDGIVKQIASFLSLAIAILFAGVLASHIRGFITIHSILTGIPFFIITGVCYVISFSIIILFFYWLGRLLTVALSVTPAKWINILLGGIFGALKWILVLSLVFNLLIVFDPQSHVLNKQTREKSVLYKGIENVVPTIYPYIEHYFFKT